MSSQPLFTEEKEEGLGQTVSRAITTGTNLTPKQIQDALNRFEANLTNYLSESASVPILDDDVLEVKAGLEEEKEKSTNLLIRYKIGRFNPPHKGHIELFVKNIKEMEAAKMANPTLQTKVVIFAGNGAKSEPRSKNPLDFETKKTVILYLLRQALGLSPDTNIDNIVEIRQKDYKDATGTNITPVSQIVEVAGSQLVGNPFLSNVDTQLAVSTKEDDAKKLGFMNKALSDEFSSKYPGLKFSSEIVAMEPVKVEGGGGLPVEQSATKIREIAKSSTSVEEFKNRVSQETRLDYGTMASVVFDAIKASLIDVTAPPQTKKNKTIGGRSKKNKKTKNKKTKTKRLKNRKTSKYKKY
jgi:hypothetical protein